MNRVSEEQLKEAINGFQFEGNLISIKPYGSGHINDTYLLTYEIGKMGSIRVILQRVNQEIFTNPVELMQNIEGVTTYLKKIIKKNGGDPERETLNLIPAKDEKYYFVGKTNNGISYKWTYNGSQIQNPVEQKLLVQCTEDGTEDSILFSQRASKFRKISSSFRLADSKRSVS